MILETDSILFDTDSYKLSHFKQDPPGTTSSFSYIESRGGRYSHMLFFGLQYYLKRYLSRQVTVKEVEEAKIFYTDHGVPFNYDGWMFIAKQLKGRLPLRVRAVKEGYLIPTHNVLVTIESTHKDFAWLPSWIETSILRIWHPITVATISYGIKQLIRSYLDKTSDDTNAELLFKLHDFGSRGAHSKENASWGGAAHLVNFMGSDTVTGIYLANKYYNCKMSAFSIPASEHSTITGWGRDGELEAYANMLKQFAKPGSIVACVSDSYDIYHAVDKLWGVSLRQQVIDSGATIVIRPDSGDPKVVVLDVVRLLDKNFGHTLNTKGYKVLNNVRVIQGDGVCYESIQEILEVLTLDGYSTTNIAFGMGGALLAHHNRDTQKFAMKRSSITINGEQKSVCKDPITDPGKRSKSGRLDLIIVDNQYKTVVIEGSQISQPDSVMHTVFEDGELFDEITLDEVRANSSKTTYDIITSLQNQ